MEQEVDVKREATWKRLEEIAAGKAKITEPVLVTLILPARITSGL